MVVVDDASPTDLGSTLAAFEDRLSLRWIRQDRAGPAAARNRGARSTEAEVLAFTDDDCQPEPDWLTRMLEPLEPRGRVMVGGRTVNALADNPWADASQALVSYLYDYYLRSGRERMFFTSNNLALARSDFLSIGGFDEGFGFAGGEDREFCERWRRSGGEFAYAEAATVNHHHDMSGLGFVRQQFRYGRGAFLLNARKDDGLVPEVEPGAFYRGMARWPFRAPSKLQATRQFLFFGIAQVANLTGYVAEAGQTAVGRMLDGER